MSLSEIPSSNSFVARCANSQNSAKETIPTVFSYSYTVESDQYEGDVPYTVREEIPRRVSKAAVETVARRLCNNNEIVVAGKQNRRKLTEELQLQRSLQGLKKCFVSVSSGSYFGDQKVRSGCSTRRDESLTCTLYMGALQVEHTADCTRGEVRQVTLMALKIGVDQDEFLDLANPNELTNVTSSSTNPYITNVDMHKGMLIPRAEGQEIIWDENGSYWKEATFVSVFVGMAALLGIFFVLRRQYTVKRTNLEKSHLHSQEDW